MRILFSALVLGLAVSGFAGAGDKPKDKPEEKVVTTKSGLKYVELKEGTGERAREGDTVDVHYTGWLKDGTKLDSSVDRKLIIPSELAYGKEGRPPVIPSDAELTFEVELLRIK
jgi:FKBP-type peptidyl-prolyl cis-trans isomerase